MEETPGREPRIYVGNDEDGGPVYIDAASMKTSEGLDRIDVTVITRPPKASESYQAMKDLVSRAGKSLEDPEYVEQTWVIYRLKRLFAAQDLVCKNNGGEILYSATFSTPTWNAISSGSLADGVYTAVEKALNERKPVQGPELPPSIEPGHGEPPSFQTMYQSAQGPETCPEIAQPRYAGFWIRFAAWLLDMVVLSLPLFLYNRLSSRISHPGGAYLAALFIGWLYQALLESSKYQATVGKMATGIKVTDLFGNRISFLRATGRYFAMSLSGILFCIGYIMIPFSRRKQGLHDMLAGTLVVKDSTD